MADTGLKLYFAVWRDGRVSLLSGVNMRDVVMGLETVGEAHNCLLREYNKPLHLTFKPQLPDFTPLGSSRFCAPRRKIPDPVSELQADLEHLLSDGSSADVELVCHGRSFKCHSVILASRCSFFRGVFSSGMTESINRTINMNNIEANVMQIILTYIYTAAIEIPELEGWDIKVKFLLKVAEASDYLLLKTLKDLVHIQCAEVLRSELDLDFLGSPKADTLEEDSSLMHLVASYKDLHPKLQYQLLFTVHMSLRFHDDAPEMSSSFDEEFINELIKFVTKECREETLYLRNYRFLHDWMNRLDCKSKPDVYDFKDAIQTPNDLNHIHALHKVCRMWEHTKPDDWKIHRRLINFAKYLIAEGFDVTTQDLMGNVPLHYAVEYCSVPLVKLILEVADCKGIMNYELETPCDYVVNILAKKLPSRKRKAFLEIHRLLSPLSFADTTTWLSDDQFKDVLENTVDNFDDLAFDWIPNMGFDCSEFVSQLREVSFPMLAEAISNSSEKKEVSKKLALAIRTDLFYRVGKRPRPEYNLNVLGAEHTLDDTDSSDDPFS